MNEYNQRPEVKEKIKEYYQRPEVKKRIANNIKNRRKVDINFRIKCILRSSTNSFFTNTKIIRKAHTTELLGCTIKEAVQHIENQFDERMTWENHGVKTWQIDHKIAFCTLDLTILENQKICCHYTNLQPLWHTDHHKKSIEDKKKSIKNKYIY
jgi:hypothetical protein